ncbi:putative glutamine synthetase [Streptomyces sp. W007]|nr:putative glutamine synthetase [Streptomyces sp. W007]
MEGRSTTNNVDNSRQPIRRSQGATATYLQVATVAVHFLRNKKQEWEEYRSEVTAFELKNLLPVL